MTDRQREIREAMEAADEALRCLHAAQERLNSARNWGIYDILGGGMLATMVKRSRMSDAQQELAQAKAALRRFAGELRDVGETLDSGLGTGDFLAFADYFFDGAVADWLVQSRISDARRQVDDAIRRVSAARARLAAME